MRKPWFWKQRAAWYVDAVDGDGQTRRIRLSSDRESAMQIWEKMRGNESAVCTKGLSVLSGPTVRIRYLKPKRRKSSKRKSIDRRRAQHFERVLLIAELLAPLRYGATIDELVADVAETLRRYRPCTIKRDLEFLKSLDLIEQLDSCVSDRYRWRDQSIRAAIVERMADVVADTRE